MITRSKTQTQKFAAKLAKKILRPTPYALRAKVIALHGDLGAGKTTFVQGFIKALGVKHHITSPTFVIFRKYHLGEKLSFGEGSAFGGKVKSKTELKISKPYTLTPKPYSSVYHFDLYRIHSAKELYSFYFKKIISNPENIVLIEWPERVKKILLKNTIWINFSHSKRINERKIILSLPKDKF